METVNSALGPINTSDLGFTLSHEHICERARRVSDHVPRLPGPNGNPGARRPRPDPGA